MYCRKCGKQIVETAKYCPYCGIEVPEFLVRHNKTEEINLSKMNEKVNESEELDVYDETLHLTEELNKKDNLSNKNKKKFNNRKAYIIIGITLSCILIIALVINSINNHQEKTIQNDIVISKIKFSDYGLVSYIENDNNGMYIVHSQGYNGTNVYCVGVKDKKITSFDVIDFADNNQYGEEIADYNYLSKFIGMSLDNSIDNVTGATKTAKSAVNAAYSAMKEADSKMIVRIEVSNLKVRDYPSTSIGVKVDLVKKGQTFVVDEYTSDGSYTWYKIGDNRWIATDGSYISIISGSAKYNGNYKDIGVLETNSRVIVYSSPNASEYRETRVRDYYKINDTRIENNVIWYEVGENEWINSNDDVDILRVTPNGYMFKLTVKNKPKSIYYGPSKSYGQTDYELSIGQTFEVYDIQTNEGYTFYKISSYEDKWVRNSDDSFYIAY